MRNVVETMAGPVRWLSLKSHNGAGRHRGGRGGVHVGFLYRFLQSGVSVRLPLALGMALMRMQYSHAWDRHCPWCSIGMAGGIAVWAVIVGSQYLRRLAIQVISRWYATALATFAAFPIVGGALALGIGSLVWILGLVQIAACRDAQYLPY